LSRRRVYLLGGGGRRSPRSPSRPGFLVPALRPPRRNAARGHYHTANVKEEAHSLDRVGSRTAAVRESLAAIDNTTAASISPVVMCEREAVLFSRGFSSIYGEWETTADAQTADRTFSESSDSPRRRAGRIRRQEADANKRVQISGRLRSTLR